MPGPRLTRKVRMSSVESAPRGAAVRLATILLAIESLAVFGLTAWQIVELVRGDLVSVATSIALIVMSLAAAVGLAAFAFAVRAGRSWGKSGGIVAQVLIFAIAVGSVQGGAAHWGIAAVLAIPAVVTFVALLLSARGGTGDPRRG